MTAALAPSRTGTAIADLVLVRMALPGKTKPPPAKVRADVGKLLGTTLSATEFDDLRRSLAADGLLVMGKRNVFAVTPDGRERATQFLGLEEMPARLTWKQVIAKHLFPVAAGLSPEQAVKLSTGDKLAAHLLKDRLNLTDAPGGTVNAVVTAYVCKELGFEAERSLNDILCLILTRLVGAERRLKKKDIERHVARHQLDVSSLSADLLRQRLIRDYLTGRPESLPPLATREEPLDLPAFANTVLKLARISPPADRFHDNKVFIAPLWRASQREPNFPRLSLAEFKGRLIQANREGLLHLSRADLVQAMDPRLVAESETSHLTATFHFVRLEGDRP